MHYLKYIFITILLYATQVNAIHLTDKLEQIDKKQIIEYLNNQPFYERQSSSDTNFVFLVSFILGSSYFIDKKLIVVPIITLLSFLLTSVTTNNELSESTICDTYYNNILKSKFLANIIDNNPPEIEIFLYNNTSGDINNISDNITELFCDWIVLYRRNLRSNFFSVIDRKKNYMDLNVDEIMNIDVSSSNQLARYAYLKKIKFNLIEKKQTVKTKFLVNTLQQNGIHLLTNNNQKYVGIIKDDDTCYLLFGIELKISESKRSNNIITKLKEEIIGSDYIDPECTALVMKFNVANIKQNIVPFLYRYFGTCTKVDLYNITLNNTVY